MLSYKVTKSGSDHKPLLNKRPIISVYDDEIDEDELGEETEAEKHLKTLLHKQLNTKISVKDQFAQHRTFSCPSTYNSLTELIQGTCTLDEFKEIEKNEELHQELQRCGLSDEEIKDYILYRNGNTKGKYHIDPEVRANYIKEIEAKVKAHNEELLKPQAFKNVKMLSRHEMEIEKSLYAGCPEKSKLSTLVSVLEENSTTDVDAAFKHIKDLSHKLLNSRKRKQKMKKDGNKSAPDVNNSETEESDFQFDSNIHHVVVPLDEEAVREKRLSIDEIKKLPKFENYKMGNASKTLYLKNLHPKITIQELRSLFGGFEEENRLPIDYKICTGRMKGQAFIKFSGVEISEKALKHANGFMLRGKPVIIEFGRQS